LKAAEERPEQLQNTRGREWIKDLFKSFLGIVFVKRKDTVFLKLAFPVDLMNTSLQFPALFKDTMNETDFTRDPVLSGINEFVLRSFPICSHCGMTIKGGIWPEHWEECGHPKPLAHSTAAAGYSY
jgi:hypothetical protein